MGRRLSFSTGMRAEVSNDVNTDSIEFQVGVEVCDGQQRAGGQLLLLPLVLLQELHFDACCGE